MLYVDKLNDLKLYAYSLFEIIPTYFITKHHKYSRWMLLIDLAN